MKRLLMVLVVAMLAMGANQAQAMVVIDFQTGLAGVGGVYTLSGSNATGVGIPIGAVTITGAPSNNGVFLVTGTAAGTGPGGPFGSLDFDTLANTISITGSIVGLGINSPVSLLSGSFSSFVATSNGINNAVGPDTKARSLLLAIGVSPTTPFQLFGFSTTTSGVNADGVGSIISTDVRNTAVPEPGSMLLLGTGLFGLAGAVRRRLKK